jgi:hypothetical protein
MPSGNGSGALHVCISFQLTLSGTLSVLKFRPDTSPSCFPTLTVSEERVGELGICQDLGTGGHLPHERVTRPESIACFFGQECMVSVAFCGFFCGKEDDRVPAVSSVLWFPYKCTIATYKLT